MACKLSPLKDARVHRWRGKNESLINSIVVCMKDESVVKALHHVISLIVQSFRRCNRNKLI